MKATVKEEKWELRLYIAGNTAKSKIALSNLNRVCEKNLKGKYVIEIVDLIRQPQLAELD